MRVRVHRALRGTALTRPGRRRREDVRVSRINAKGGGTCAPGRLRDGAAVQGKPDEAGAAGGCTLPPPLLPPAGAYPISRFRRLTISLLGTAPTIWSATLPPLKNSSVGIDIIP